MRVIIVDDEELARAVLREFLAQHGDIEIVAECANGFEAVKAIAELRPDLVFLDIQMPQLDGFETLAALDPAHMPAVVVNGRLRRAPCRLCLSIGGRSARRPRI